jgi:hypothetical protein
LTREFVRMHPKLAQAEFPLLTVYMGDRVVAWGDRKFFVAQLRFVKGDLELTWQDSSVHGPGSNVLKVEPAAGSRPIVKVLEQALKDPNDLWAEYPIKMPIWGP